jgi:hypothetical protein
MFRTMKVFDLFSLPKSLQGMVAGDLTGVYIEYSTAMPTTMRGEDPVSDWLVANGADFDEAVLIKVP